MVDHLHPDQNGDLRGQDSLESVRFSRLRDTPPELRSIAQEIEGISGAWNMVELCTPDRENLVQEKNAFLDAFLEDREYHPVFQYSRAEQCEYLQARKKLEALLPRLRAVDVSDDAARLLSAALEAKILDDLATCDCIEGMRSRDERMIKDAVNRKYPPLETELLEQEEREFAEAIALDPQTMEGDLSGTDRTLLEQRQLSPEEIREAFVWALDQYGLLNTGDSERGYKVLVSDTVQFIDVRHRSAEGPTIFIPAHSKRSLRDVLRLMRHEIEGHARQSANGEALFGFGAGGITVDDETLYEGLAMRLETDFEDRHFGHQIDHSPRFYARAIQLAEQGASFGEIFRDQYRRMLHLALKIPLDQSLPSQISVQQAAHSRDAAWKTTYRIMRGHTDMRNPEAYALRKDLAYSRGFKLDAALCKRNQGHLNEAVILPPDMLPLLQIMNLQQTDLPYPDKQVTEQYLQKTLSDVHAMQRNTIQDQTRSGLKETL